MAPWEPPPPPHCCRWLLVSLAPCSLSLLTACLIFLLWLVLAALNEQGGYFRSGEVMFWREGQGEWRPLAELPALQAALQEAPPAGGDAGSGAPTASSDAVAGVGPPAAPRRGRGARAAAAKAVPADPALAGFLSEISALEAGEEVAAGEGEAPASPPPDERRFEDDDGTVYVWDSSLRKFMPEGDAAVGATAAAAGAAAAGAAAAKPAAAPASYQEEDMVFVPDEEEIPEYQPPPKVRLLLGGGCLPRGGLGQAMRGCCCAWLRPAAAGLCLLAFYAEAGTKVLGDGTLL